MDVDNTDVANHLYMRGYTTGDTHVIVDPGGTMPIYPGIISTFGRGGDKAMTYGMCDRRPDYRDRLPRARPPAGDMQPTVGQFVPNPRSSKRHAAKDSPR